MACAPAPTVVVGNIAVGGTGKSPLVIALAEALTARGLRAGVVSRGYGGRAQGYPCEVTAESDPGEVGDEALMIVRRTSAPMYVAPDRPQAVARLVCRYGVDVVLSDDGLQHYAMARDLEIADVDGERHELPGNVVKMRLQPDAWVRVADGERLALDSWQGSRRVHAVAAIGNPGRFFATLRELDLQPVEHPYEDHAVLGLAELSFEDALPVVMTEKDAVKCRFSLPHRHYYYLQVSAQLPEGLVDGIIGRLGLTNGAQES